MKKENSLFKALADATRREILKMLRDRDLTPGKMIEKFDITKPSLSHHLEILKNADLVITQRKGKNIIYSLNVSVFEEIMALFLDLFNPHKGE